MKRIKEESFGTLAACAAFGMWGLFPLYWKQLLAVNSLEILAHRIVWSAIFAIAILFVSRKIQSLFQIFIDRKKLILVACAATLISLNWGIYIWAVNSGHITDSSLGYYINPLVSVAFGAIFFGERFNKRTKIAIAIAAIGVLAASLRSGTVPWIALALAFSFGAYGVVKKKAGFDPIAGLGAETLVLLPLALAYLVFRHATGQGAFAVEGGLVTTLLVLCGPVTAIPLFAFAAATNRIPLTRLGFIQYISPTLQLAIGLFVYKEQIPASELIAFAAVIIAVILYTTSLAGPKSKGTSRAMN